MANYDHRFDIKLAKADIDKIIKALISDDGMECTNQSLINSIKRQYIEQNYEREICLVHDHLQRHKESVDHLIQELIYDCTILEQMSDFDKAKIFNVKYSLEKTKNEYEIAIKYFDALDHFKASRNFAKESGGHVD